MRTIRLTCILALATLPVAMNAQQMQHAESSGWKELDAFHKVLAASWHPAAQGDVKAARASATALLDAALAWRKSKGPNTCDNAKTREGLTQMITELRWHADAVKRESSDDAVKVTLKTVHTTFESFAEACMHAGMKPAEVKKP